MTADGTPGSKNQPQFLGTGAPATAADLNEIANYAALVGNVKVLDTTGRTALSGNQRWPGLIVFDTTTSTLYIWDGAGWVRLMDLGAFPFSMEQGSVACPAAGGGGVAGGIGWSALIDVAFTPGRFSVAPHVKAVTVGPSGQITAGGAVIEQVTASGCKVRGLRVGSEPNNLFSVEWTAVQMQAGSAVG